VDLSDQSVKELSERYLGPDRPCPDEVLAALQADPRAGVRALAKKIEARRAAHRAEGQRLRNLLRFETELWEAGHTHIAGTDEVGVGPLAGPVLAAAVILPRDFRPRGINDSKQLDEPELLRLAAEIKASAVAWAVGRAEVEEIDRLNILQAGLLAMRRAVDGLAIKPDYLLVDARELKHLPIPQKGIVKGDARSLTIAAASIVAKTTRDALMVELDAACPGYGLARHKGYPVPEHLEALKRLGPSALHRRSFAPVREAAAAVAAAAPAPAPSGPAPQLALPLSPPPKGSP
jgi:ribonuclease HII